MQSHRSFRGRSNRPHDRFTRLLAEHLEERTLLAGATCDSNSGTILVCYQVRVVPVNGALFAPDPQNSHALVATPDLTSLNVGDSFDLVLTTQSSDPTYYGVYAAYVDVGYDSTKAHVPLAETQNIHLSGSGTFTLNFNGDITQSITKVSDAAAMRTAIQNALAALPSIGVGNVEVVPTSASLLSVRFIGKFTDQ